MRCSRPGTSPLPRGRPSPLSRAFSSAFLSVSDLKDGSRAVTASELRNILRVSSHHGAGRAAAWFPASHVCCQGQRPAEGRRGPRVPQGPPRMEAPGWLAPRVSTHRVTHTTTAATQPRRATGRDAATASYGTRIPGAESHAHTSSGDQPFSAGGHMVPSQSPARIFNAVHKVVGKPIIIFTVCPWRGGTQRSSAEAPAVGDVSRRLAPSREGRSVGPPPPVPRRTAIAHLLCVQQALCKPACFVGTITPQGARIIPALHVRKLRAPQGSATCPGPHGGEARVGWNPPRSPAFEHLVKATRQRACWRRPQAGPRSELHGPRSQMPVPRPP